MGNAAGLAGQWMQFVLCGWVAFSQGSYLYSSLYFLSVAAPSALPLPRVRLLGMLGPIGVLSVFLVGEPSLPLLIGSGLAAGLATAGCGRPLAISSGFTGGPGWAGTAGAALCIFIPGLVGIQTAAWFAAGLLAVAVVAGESHDRRGSLPSALLPAAMALATVSGLRVLEPGFDSGLRGFAAFATAWALGVQTGWRASPNADARAVLAAPFLGAMALTGLGYVSGPGLIFLYGFLGACCSVVGGSGLPRTDQSMPLNRRALLVGTAAGALWANAPYDFSVIANWTAGAMIAGGIVSSFIAQRAPAPEVQVSSPEPPRLESPQLDVENIEAIFPPAAAIEEPVLTERQVVELLLDATRAANQIRRDALLELKRARTVGTDLPKAKDNVKAAISELLEELSQLKGSLSAR